MDSVANSASGISFLTQPGTGLLSDLPVKISASTLQSAAPQDVVSLSASAVQMQEVDGLFGIAAPQTVLPEPSLPSPATSVNPTPAAADSPSTPQQSYVADGPTQQALVQGLFYPSVINGTNTNVLA